MICPRHLRIARFEHGLCGECFQEAAREAAKALFEAKLAAMRLTSADALIRRLSGR